MNIKKAILSLVILITSSSYGVITQFDKESVHVPHNLGDISFGQEGKTFYAVDGEESIEINKHNIDPLIRNMNTDTVMKFLKKGYVTINQRDNGEYTVKAHGRLKGGGIIGANIGFWIGKIGTYVVAGGLITGAATTAAVVTVGTGGSAGAIIGSSMVSGGIGTAIAGVTAVEATSNSVAVGLAIFFGTITGPI